MDAESHMAILEGMFQIHPIGTMIIVTHRLEGLETFDKVIHLADGRITEITDGKQALLK